MTGQYEAPKPLREPRGKFQETVRRLADVAMAKLYHDIDPSLPEWTNGMRTLEREFTNILRGKLKP